METNCDGCTFRSIPKNTAEHFGHTKCSFHRECTGNTFWEPQFCTHCTNAEHSWEQMDTNTRFATMGKFSRMLEATKGKINNSDPNRMWDHTPIMDFKFRRFHFNNVDQDQQNHNVPTQQAPDQVQSPNSPPDQDCLLIDPEQESFDESEDDSDASDLRESIEGVHSINQMLRDVCTDLHCINMNTSAQCNDPVHTTQVFALRHTVYLPRDSRTIIY